MEILGDLFRPWIFGHVCFEGNMIRRFCMESYAMHSTQCFFKHESELLYIHRHTVLCTKIIYIYHLSIYIQIITLLHRYVYTG